MVFASTWTGCRIAALTRFLISASNSSASVLVVLVGIVCTDSHKHTVTYTDVKLKNRLHSARAPEASSQRRGAHLPRPTLHRET